MCEKSSFDLESQKKRSTGGVNSAYRKKIVVAIEEGISPGGENVAVKGSWELKETDTEKQVNISYGRMKKRGGGCKHR